ncbi:hypothetical protein SynBIOSE41_00306 [Synechococcus sp. BIOS-E4-1]|uniref:polysaccharide deacetylase WbmS family protein n=1 Tax=Synechococcus sp. BIOS-E4-1 TaxID=1400864 RepID=UPI001648BA88|nr:hypothetical protein [Synechococcus sp. BIOS-E4-1]QNI52875.1 hypothetical protein SynBIOSE41_00306 [Synechococcus sp. BIOS-E4-1]
MVEFIHFRDIDPVRASSWVGKRVLSIDIDWAHDVVLEDTINLIEQAAVKACFFVTHETPLLERLRSNPLFELGLHPNFDPLLRGEAARSARDIVNDLARVVPEAQVLRSHAMTTSGRWLELYREAGITHVSNYLMFGDVNIHPFYQLNGLVEAPVFFADDGLLFQRTNSAVSFDLDVELLASSEGLRVFNYHPIHLFLNSENLERYSRVRNFLNDPVALKRMRFEGNGSRTWLSSLLRLI